MGLRALVTVNNYYSVTSLYGRTIRKVMGGGSEVQKKVFAQGKIKWKKNNARQFTLKNIHSTAKKNSHKEFDNEKKFLRLKNFPPPPISFLMVRPLRTLYNTDTSLLRDSSFGPRIAKNHTFPTSIIRTPLCPFGVRIKKVWLYCEFKLTVDMVPCLWCLNNRTQDNISYTPCLVCPYTQFSPRNRAHT